MLDIILQQRYMLVAVILFTIGLMVLFLHPNLIKKLIGMDIMDAAIMLMLASGGYVEGREAPIIQEGITDFAHYINPVPSGLVLTGIVVSVSMTAFFLALTLRLYARYRTINLDEILMQAKKEVK